MLETNKIYCMDALKGLQQMEDNSVNLVLIDPPYFKIMKKDWRGTKYSWDNQWKNFKEYLNWIYSIAKECKRVLKDNGSFFIFCDDRRSHYIRVKLDELNWILINEIIWWKRNNMNIKGWAQFRCFVPTTERILFYGNPEEEYIDGCEGIKKHLYSKIRQYLIEEKNKVNLTLDQVNMLVGTASMAGHHYFANSQWCFPTKEHYERMQLTFNVVFKKIMTIKEASEASNEEIKSVLRKDYDVLRKDYDVLRKDYDVLRRSFSPDKNFTDVWDIPIIGGKENVKHPTKKPLKLIERIVKTCSNENDLIIDPFMGSGTTALASLKLNRRFIGFELNQEYVEMANKRIKPWIRQKRLF